MASSGRHRCFVAFVCSESFRPNRISDGKFVSMSLASSPPIYGDSQKVGDLVRNDDSKQKTGGRLILALSGT